MKQLCLLCSTLWLLACGSGPSHQNELLNTLRTKNQKLNGSQIDPEADLKTFTKSDPPQQTRTDSLRNTSRELNEVKLITPAMLETDYPTTDYITGVGYTEKLDLNEAMLNAKEQVAAAINSEIESSTIVRIGAERVEANGSIKEKSSYSHQEMKSVQRVKFSNAELIKIDSKRTRCDDERCIAVAFIKREELASESLGRFIPLEQRARRIITTCNTLADQGDTLGFAERFATLEQLMKSLNELGPGLEVILGRLRFKNWNELKDLHTQLTARQDEINALTPLVIDTQGIASETLREVLGNAHREALLTLGVKTRFFLGEGDACHSQPPSALHYSLAGELKRSSISGIVIHQLDYSISVKPCSSSQMIAKQRLNLKFSVPNNASYEASAQRRLSSKKTELQKSLYEALHLTLPLSKP